MTFFQFCVVLAGAAAIASTVLKTVDWLDGSR